MSQQIHCPQPPKAPCAQIAVGFHVNQPTKVDMNVGDTYDTTFTDPGFFAYSPTTLFDSTIRMGYYDTGDTTTTVTAIAAGTVTIIYLDTETLTPYVEYIFISPAS